MRHILGRTRLGRPVYAIAGGSGTNVPPVGGDTITVQEGDRPKPPSEESPAEPAPTSMVDPGAFQRGTQDPSQSQQQQSPPPATSAGRTFSEEDVARIRQEEKDKLYPEKDKLLRQVENLKTMIEEQRAEKEAEKAAREEEAAKQAEERRKQEEQGLDPTELIQRKEQEWVTKLEELESRIAEEARQRAVAEEMVSKEREYAEVQRYLQEQVASHADDIMPQLTPYVQGATREEVDASIAQQIDTSNRILADMQQAQQQRLQQIPGPRVTQPGANPGDPVEQAGGTRQFSVEELRNMTPQEWAKNRDQLLPAAGRHGPYGSRQ
jgi:hypothetical protein